MKKFTKDQVTYESTALYTLFSLFVILMAFFMALNAYSNFEDTRVGKVLGSVEETFTTKIFNLGAGPSFVADLSKGRGNGFSNEDLGNMFKSSMAGVEPYLMPSRGFLSVELSPDNFTEMTKSLGQNQVPTTLAAMVLRVLEGKDKSVPNLQMEIWVKAGDAKLSSELNIADQFIQNITARGITATRVSAGVNEAVTSGKILLMFRPYSPYGVRG